MKLLLTLYTLSTSVLGKDLDAFKLEDALAVKLFRSRHVGLTMLKIVSMKIM